MKTVFLFSLDATGSPMVKALEFGAHRLVRLQLERERFECPITAPPELVVIEPAPDAALPTLLSRLQRHPVVGRVPWLLVLDTERVVAAARLPCRDFIVRGFSAAEAVARVDRLLGATGRESLGQVIFDKLVVDLDGFEARIDDEPLPLTPQEFNLLGHIVQQPGRAMSREELLHRVWGRTYEGGARTVDIHVRRLRAKLGTPYAAHLKTVRSVGYKWVAER